MSILGITQTEVEGEEEEQSCVSGEPSSLVILTLDRVTNKARNESKEDCKLHALRW